MVAEYGSCCSAGGGGGCGSGSGCGSSGGGGGGGGGGVLGKLLLYYAALATDINELAET